LREQAAKRYGRKSPLFLFVLKDAFHPRFSSWCHDKRQAEPR
jgi:hypothetical protein